MRSLLAYLIVIGCAARAPRSTDVAGVHAPRTNHDVIAGSRPCSTTPQELGHVRDDELDEISGLVESTKNPEVLFVHNDSGDSPRFFAINRAGALLAELELDTVPRLVDAEDIAIGPGPGGAPFIYLGDTGNNFASSLIGIPRRKAVLYRIPEPEIRSSARHAKVKLREAFPIVLTYPDGARNVEAFFVDPVNGDFVAITRESDGLSQVLTANAAQLAGGGGPLRVLGHLRFGRAPLPGSHTPTSAAISKNGRRILVRTYSSIFLFSRRDGESPMNALLRAPLVYPSPKESQGEAIAFVDRETSFITLSEGRWPAVNCASLGHGPNRNF